MNKNIIIALLVLIYARLSVQQQQDDILFSFSIDNTTSYWNFTQYSLTNQSVISFTQMPYPFLSLIGILDYNSTSNQLLVFFVNDKVLDNSIGLVSIQTGELTKVAHSVLNDNALIITQPMGYDSLTSKVYTVVTNLQNNSIVLIEWDFSKESGSENAITFDYEFANNTLPSGCYNEKVGYYYIYYIDEIEQSSNLLIYSVDALNHTVVTLNNIDLDISVGVFLIHTANYFNGGRLFALAQNDNNLELYSINVFQGSVKTVLSLPNQYPSESQIPYATSQSQNFITLFTSNSQNQTTYTVFNLLTLQVVNEFTQLQNNIISNSWFMMTSN